MKNKLILGLGVFAFSLLIQFDSNKNLNLETSAFAGAQCCPELGSMCSFNGQVIFNYGYFPLGCPKVVREDN